MHVMSMKDWTIATRLFHSPNIDELHEAFEAPPKRPARRVLRLDRVERPVENAGAACAQAKAA